MKLTYEESIEFRKIVDSPLNPRAQKTMELVKEIIKRRNKEEIE